MSVLKNLQPERVFYYFEEITKIPHGSGNTKQISDYLAEFARNHGLKYIQDESNNIIIFKEASKGYEKAPCVILQGHMDMVCEKKGNDDFYTHEVTMRIQDDGKAMYLSNHILEDRPGMIPDYQYRCGE